MAAYVERDGRLPDVLAQLWLAEAAAGFNGDSVDNTPIHRVAAERLRPRATTPAPGDAGPSA